VTHLRQLMLEELECRNYAPGTITNYIRTVERFAWHFHRVPDQLGPEHIRQYQAAMFREWKLSQNTVSQRLGRSTLLLHSGCGAANLNFPKPGLRQVRGKPRHVAFSISMGLHVVDPSGHYATAPFQRAAALRIRSSFSCSSPLRSSSVRRPSRSRWAKTSGRAEYR
jgi:Phage integrase, N-terminal SAM-like domain